MVRMAGLGWVVSGHADTIALTGVGRDFTPATNPDFEYTIADDHAITTGALDGGGKPVYANPDGSTVTTHSQARFDAWYHQPLNNGMTSLPVSTTLDNGLATPGGVYSCNNSNFFPIDGQLLGHYAFGHNSHFTFELHSKFTYTWLENFSSSTGLKLVTTNPVPEPAAWMAGTLSSRRGHCRKLAPPPLSRSTTRTSHEVTSANTWTRTAVNSSITDSPVEASLQPGSLFATD